VDESGWFIQIYEVSDVIVQQAITSLLDGIDTLTVQASRSGRDAYVIVECSGDEQAWSVHRFVTSSDPGATLVHSSASSTHVIEPRRSKRVPLWS